MDRTRRCSALGISLVLLVAGLAACDRRVGDDVEARQTKFPGQVTAGGGTSGEVIGRSAQGPSTPGPSGTPGIPQGSGGNVGGAALGGTTGASSDLGGTGEKTAEQARKEPLPGPDPAGSAPPAAPPGAASR